MQRLPVVLTALMRVKCSAGSFFVIETCDEVMTSSHEIKVQAANSVSCLFFAKKKKKKNVIDAKS